RGGTRAVRRARADRRTGAAAVALSPPARPGGSAYTLGSPRREQPQHSRTAARSPASAPPSSSAGSRCPSSQRPGPRSSNAPHAKNVRSAALEQPPQLPQLLLDVAPDPRSHDRLQQPRRAELRIVALRQPRRGPHLLELVHHLDHVVAVVLEPFDPVRRIPADARVRHPPRRPQPDRTVDDVPARPRSRPVAL